MVTIKGTIEYIQNDSSFTIENQAYFDSDRILVINSSGEPIPELPEENIALQITGKVEKVNPAEFFEGMEVELPADLPAELRDKPGIYANSIVLAPDPRKIIEIPSNFYNRKILVEGEVAEVLNDNIFTLAQHSYALPEDKDLLVLNATSEPLPANTDKVSIQGVVRPYNRQRLEQDYGEQILTENLDEKYTNAGVLIVESISPSDVDFSEVDVDVSP